MIFLAASLCSIDIQSGTADFVDQKLSLAENVTVQLPDTTTLTCSTALFDILARTLSLDEAVKYNTPDFSVTCKQLLATLKTATLSLEALEEATALGEVTLSHRKGDSIHAQSAHYHPLQKTVVFEKPEGMLVTHPRETTFYADSLTWNIDTQQLLFKDNVHVEQNEFGTFDATDQILIQQDAQRQLRILIATGDLVLKLPRERTLTCHGTLIIDHMKRTLELTGTPLTFCDPHGEIQADQATFTYAFDHEQHPEIVKITLSQNVKIADFATVNKVKSDMCLHYILTDHATLDPSTQTVVLTADPGKRTLLFDKVNNIQASAPGLTVTRNKATQKETIQGIGDVRFNFSENELNRLKQQFEMIKDAK